MRKYLQIMKGFTCVGMSARVKLWQMIIKADGRAYEIERETRDDNARRNQELRSLERIVGVSPGRGRVFCWGGRA